MAVLIFKIWTGCRTERTVWAAS